MYADRNDYGNIYNSKPFTGNTLLINSSLIKAGYEYLRRSWASIMNLGICREVTRELSNLSPENYRDITIEPFLAGHQAIYAFLEDGRRIRLGDLGEGIQNYFIARILYEIEKPKILLWDDMESHFNPKMLSSLASWFSCLLEKGKQIIVTTHSVEAARIIANLNEEKAGIYLTSLKQGVLQTKKFKLDEIEELWQAGVDVRVAEPFLL